MRSFVLALLAVAPLALADRLAVPRPALAVRQLRSSATSWSGESTTWETLENGLVTRAPFRGTKSLFLKLTEPRAEKQRL